MQRKNKMSRQKQEWDDWVDLDTPGDEPLKLREGAPDKIKKQFEEWQRQDAEDKAKGIWR